MRVIRHVTLGLVAVALGCADPQRSTDTGGTSQLAGACGRGLSVVLSDYQSSNVALVDTFGRTLSGSFLSSGSARSGLSAALSGDVVLAGAVEAGSEIALIDRYPAAVITLIDIASSLVSAQIDVSTGFRANPYDVAATAGKVWVSRYGTNPSPGKRAFDRGGDLLRIDRASRAIVASRALDDAMADAPNFQPNPGRMVILGDRVYLLLAAYDAKLVTTAPSRVVVIDTNTGSITGTHVLQGMHGCGAIALEPPFDAAGSTRASRRLLIGCSGKFGGTSEPTLQESGVVVLAIGSAGVDKEIRRYSAAQLGGRPVGFDIDVDDAGHALITTMGRLGSGGDAAISDAVVEIDLDSGGHREVMRSASDAFVLGGIRCVTRITATIPNPGKGSPCSDSCFVADAERGVLHRLVRHQDGYRAVEQRRVETAIGLPPRTLGRF